MANTSTSLHKKSINWSVYTEQVKSDGGDRVSLLCCVGDGLTAVMLPSAGSAGAAVAVGPLGWGPGSVPVLVAMFLAALRARSPSPPQLLEHRGHRPVPQQAEQACLLLLLVTAQEEGWRRLPPLLLRPPAPHAVSHHRYPSNPRRQCTICRTAEAGRRLVVVWRRQQLRVEEEEGRAGGCGYDTNKRGGRRSGLRRLLLP